MENDSLEPSIPHGLECLVVSGVYLALDRIREKTGDDINWHGFRRTAATWWAEQSVPLTHVQKLLGHASITTTQIYVEADSRDVAEYMLKHYKSKMA